MVLLKYSTSIKLIDFGKKCFLNGTKQNLSQLVGIHQRRFASKYSAAVIKQFKEPLVIEDLTQRPLQKDEARISVFCCGINSEDISASDGEIEPKPSLPFVPGYEICGEILELSTQESADAKDFEKLKIGQRVIGLNFDTHAGGFASEMIISRKDIWRIDDAMAFADGASLINSYATALLALERRAAVKEGDTILVTGAGGRLGLATIDLAVNVFKCKVIGVCTGNEKTDIVRERGAWSTIILGKQDLLKEVKKSTDDGKGVSLIIETIGGETFKEVVKCIEDEGKIIVAGFASKKIPQISGDDLLENSYSVHGASLEQFRRKKFKIYREVVDEVIEMAKEGLIKPYNRTHFPLKDVNEALDLVRQRKSIGKVVLDTQ